MQKITPLEQVLKFNDAQQWHSFLTVLASMLAAQLNADYLGCRFISSVVFKSVSDDPKNTAWINTEFSDRVILNTDGAEKTCIEITFSSYARRSDSWVSLWFIGTDGTKSPDSPALKLPRNNLGTAEFIEAVADWLGRLKSPDLALLEANEL